MQQQQLCAVSSHKQGGGGGEAANGGSVYQRQEIPKYAEESVLFEARRNLSRVRIINASVHLSE